MRRLGLAFIAFVTLIGAAAAADMPVKAPIYKAPVVVPPYSWTGFYVGLNAGGSWGKQDNSLVTVPGGVTLFSNSNSLDGFIGGGQVGYNWQSDHWVFGLEADFQGSGQKDDGAFVLVPIVGARWSRVCRLPIQTSLNGLAPFAAASATRWIAGCPI